MEHTLQREFQTRLAKLCLLFSVHPYGSELRGVGRTERMLARTASKNGRLFMVINHRVNAMVHFKPKSLKKD
jgi:hypothetical protein